MTTRRIKTDSLIKIDADGVEVLLASGDEIQLDNTVLTLGDHDYNLKAPDAVKLRNASKPVVQAFSLLKRKPKTVTPVEQVVNNLRQHLKSKGIKVKDHHGDSHSFEAKHHADVVNHLKANGFKHHVARNGDHYFSHPDHPKVGIALYKGTIGSRKGRTNFQGLEHPKGIAAAAEETASAYKENIEKLHKSISAFVKKSKIPHDHNDHTETQDGHSYSMSGANADKVMQHVKDQGFKSRRNSVYLYHPDHEGDDRVLVHCRTHRHGGRTKKIVQIS